MATEMEVVVKAMKVAYEKMKEAGIEDPDIDLGPRKEPEFGNHSARASADKRAQRTMHLTLVKILGLDGEKCKTMINYFFGWELTQQVKDMQLHYAGKDEIDKGELSMVTLMM